MKHAQMCDDGPRPGAVGNGPRAKTPALCSVRDVLHQASGEAGMKRTLAVEHEPIREKIMELYADLFLHDGFGKIVMEMRFLKRGQKEIIVSSGKDFRFVVDWPGQTDAVKK